MAQLPRSCTVSVLLVDIEAAAATHIERVLEGADVGDFTLEWTTGLPAAIERLGHGDIDVVLVGPGEPAGDPMEAFNRIQQSTPDALVLPLGVAGGPTWEGQESGSAHWLPEALAYVIQRKAVEAALYAADEILFEEKERARVTLSSIGDAVLVTNTEGEVTYLNPMAETLTGWPCADATGRPLAEVFAIIDGATRRRAEDPAQRAIRADRTVGLAANCVLQRRNGGELGIEDSAAPIHDRHGQVTGAVIVFRDVSQSRTMTRKMAYLAQHDPLTGLPNRLLLEERLGQAIRMAQRHGHKVGILFVDLDGFKQINDSLGHVVGDHFLEAAADVLQTCVRDTDTVCRQGGDEFVVLLPVIEHERNTARVAETMMRRFAEPFEVDGHSIIVTLSIGISIHPDDGDDADTLINHADREMYRTRTLARECADLSSVRRIGRSDVPEEC